MSMTKMHMYDADSAGPEMIKCDIYTESKEEIEHNTEQIEPQIVNSETQTEPEDDVNELVEDIGGRPIDHGWAWMTVLGCFGVSALIVGSLKSFGVLLLELSRRLDVPVSIITATHSVAGLFHLVLAPLGNAMGDKYSYRVVVFTGGCFAGIGLIATAYAPSVEWLFITYGTIAGIGFGLTFGPALVCMGLHFNKRRSLASGLSVSGSGAGAFAIPNLMRYLLYEYGFQGCLIISGGVVLNTCCFAMLFRPPSFWNRKKTRACKTVATGIFECQSHPLLHKACEIRSCNECDTKRSLNEIELRNIKQNDDLKHNCISQRNKPEDEFISNFSTDGYEILAESTLLTGEYNNSEESVSLKSGETQHKDIEENCISHNSYNHHPNNKLKFSALTAKENKLDDSASCKTGENELNRSLMIVGGSNKYDDSTQKTASERKEDQYKMLCGKNESKFNGFDHRELRHEKHSTYFKDFSSMESLSSLQFKNISTENRKAVKKSSGCKAACGNFLHWKLLKDPVFIIYNTTFWTGIFGHHAVFTCLPSLANEFGISDTNGAFLISLVGLSDLVGRISSGWFADLKYLERKRLYQISLGLFAVCCFVFPHVTSFPGLCVMSVLSGLSTGGYAGIQISVLADVFGVENLSSSWGFVSFFASFSLLLSPFVSGLTKDISGTWTNAFRLSGIVMALGAGLVFLENLVSKSVQKQDHQRD